MATSHESHDESKHGARRLQLRIAAQAIAHHRRAVWDETKHYTWWLLAVVVVLALVGTTVGINFWIRVATILAGSVGGVLIAFIGLRVIRCEDVALDERIGAYDRLAGDLDLGEPVDATSARGGHKGVWTLIGGLFGRKTPRMDAGDYFQLGFVLAIVVYTVVFFGTLIYALVKQFA
ncbi:MAG: hypothetical protein A2133_06860 [Actinobacteria bacterium RBG_16_64_13]|nr:MAG: hypothetical protein A2133_06860 [Actinobacteria bacterium RBG_16_64_13]